MDAAAAAAAVAAAEEAVVRAPQDVRAWSRYLALRHDAGPRVRFAVFERALTHLPGSYKLWAAYLRERVRDARAKPRADVACSRTVNAFDRALLFLHKMPTLWLEYASFLDEHGHITQCRLALDRALRALPVTQHERVWKVYLNFVERHKTVWQLGTHVFPRYLQFQPRDRERYVEFLVDAGQPALAMQELRTLVLDPNAVSVRGRPLHDLWMQLCDLIVQNAEQAEALGRGKFDAEAIIRAGLRRFSDETGRLWCSLAEYHLRLGRFDQAQQVYEEALGAVSAVRDFSSIFDAYTQYHEGMLNVKIDLFGDDEEQVGEGEDENPAGGAGPEALSESAIAFYQVNAESEDRINDVDLRLAQLEHLIEERPLLLNSVMLRQNPHNCNEWHARAALFKERGDLAETVMTYQDAVKRVDPALAVGKPDSLWVELARIYEENGSSDQAQTVLRTAANVPYKEVESLVTVYCAAVELELRQKRFSEALSLVQQFVAGSPGLKSGEDGAASSEPVAKLRRQATKAPRLWMLYADLEESFGTLNGARAVYDKMIELKIATPQTILNFGAMLEENRYFEESFRAYEKGIALFSWPHVGEIWFRYLANFISRYQGEKVFRARELFEQALQEAPADLCKRFFLLLEKFEEDHGDPRRALSALDRFCAVAPTGELMDAYLLYITKAEEFFGMSRAREVFELAIEKLEDPAHVCQLCIHYAEKERRLGEIDRARAILRHGSQVADPRTALAYWRNWNDFEVAHGNEDTFREMLRVKRTVGVRFTDTNYSVARPGGASRKGFAATARLATKPEIDVRESQAITHAENDLPGGATVDGAQVSHGPASSDTPTASTNSASDSPSAKRQRTEHDGSHSESRECPSNADGGPSVDEKAHEEIAFQPAAVPAAVYGQVMHRAAKER